MLLDSLALSTVGPTAVGITRWGQDSDSHLHHVMVIFLTFFSKGDGRSVPKSFLHDFFFQQLSNALQLMFVLYS